MKRLFGFLLSILLTFSVSGQRTADYGFFGGVSSYMGDINPNRLFYSPGPAGGLLYRYNLHPRQSIRANMFLGGIKAADMDFNNDFQIKRDLSFKGFVGELAVQFEFNFLPYSTQGKRWNYTPYIAAGAGIAYFNTDSPITYKQFQPVIPFSIGFKINIYKNLGLEAEYGFRKTFYDNFDGVKDKISQEPNDKVRLYNNDWYSFAGISFTWKMYNKLLGCPAFKNEDESRRR
jgi:hypothetical protein